MATLSFLVTAFISSCQCFPCPRLSNALTHRVLARTIISLRLDVIFTHRIDHPASPYVFNNVPHSQTAPVPVPHSRCSKALADRNTSAPHLYIPRSNGDFNLYSIHNCSTTSFHIQQQTQRHISRLEILRFSVYSPYLTRTSLRNVCAHSAFTPLEYPFSSRLEIDLADGALSLDTSLQVFLDN